MNDACRPSRRCPRSAFLAALMLAPTAALALELPTPAIIGTALLNSGPRQDRTTFGTAFVADPTRGQAEAEISGTPGPSVVAQATSGPNPQVALLYDRGSAQLSYAVAVVGPAGTVPIEIGVAGGAFGSSTAGASIVTSARWDLLDAGFPIANDVVDSGLLTGGFSAGLDATVGVSIQANRAYALSLSVDAQAAASSAGSHATSIAYVAPSIALGAGVDPQLYGLALSPGIGNSPVPEPATAASLAMGIAVLTLRRRARGIRLSRGLAS